MTRLSHWKAYSSLVVGPLIAVSMYAFLGDTLTLDGRILASILTCVVIWWITEPIPLPVTALLGSGTCVVMGLGSMKSIFSAYAHPIIFLFIGSFLLAEALVVHGLDRRFGTWLLSLKWIGDRPTRVVLAIGVAVAGLSMWISNTAAAALMVPIVLGVLTTMRDEKETPATYETGMLLLVAYAASVG
ncbi:MAG: anion transporter, partial [Nitrospirae bacterium]